MLELVARNEVDHVLPHEHNMAWVRKEFNQVLMRDAALLRKWEPYLPDDRLRTRDVELVI